MDRRVEEEEGGREGGKEGRAMERKGHRGWEVGGEGVRVWLGWGRIRLIIRLTFQV